MLYVFLTCTFCFILNKLLQLISIPYTQYKWVIFLPVVQFLLCLKTFVFQSNIVIITLMFVFAYFLQKIGTGRTRGLGALAGTDEIRTMARSFFLLRVPDLCHTQERNLPDSSCDFPETAKRAVLCCLCPVEAL